METASLIASIVSVILGGVAIFLAAYFFIHAKDSETKTTNAMESIKAQTNALQKITSRQMERLTEYATVKSPDLLSKIFSEIKGPPSNLLQSFTTQLEIEKSEKEDLIAELVNAYIGMYYYSATTNLSSQWFLPPIEQYDEDPIASDSLKNLANKSYADVFTLHGILRERVHPSRIESSPFHELYLLTETSLGPLAKDATQVYADRESLK